MGVGALPESGRRRRLTRLGILCALPQEALVIINGNVAGIPISITENVVFIRSGIGERKARKCAELLIDAGADALLGFGVCGALSPDLEAGDVVVPRQVLAGDDWIIATANWQEQLSRALDAELGQSCIILHAANPVTARADKKAAFQRYGCHVVDMETLGVAAVADAKRLPWAAVRVVLDEATTEIPRLALEAIDELGQVNPGQALRGMIEHPREIPAIAKLACQSRKAFKKLRHVYQEIGPEFLCQFAEKGSAKNRR